MRSRERVPTSVSSPAVPRISARPGCTTIPRGVAPASRTVSSRRRENGLTSVTVPLARLAKNRRLASGVQAGVPSPRPPAASRRTRRLRSTTSAPLRPPRRGPTASRVRPGDSARWPPAPRGRPIRRPDARRAPRGILRRLPRAETKVLPVGRHGDAGRARHRHAPQEAAGARIDDRHAPAVEHDRRDAPVTAERDRRAAAAQRDGPHRAPACRPQDPQAAALDGVEAAPVGRDDEARGSARRRASGGRVSVRSLTSIATTVEPAATKPRAPSPSTATAVLGAGSAKRATTRSDVTSSRTSSGVPLATSATRAWAAGSGARTNASAARRATSRERKSPREARPRTVTPGAACARRPSPVSDSRR